MGAHSSHHRTPPSSLGEVSIPPPPPPPTSVSARNSSVPPPPPLPSLLWKPKIKPAPSPPPPPRMQNRNQKKTKTWAEKREEKRLAALKLLEESGREDSWKQNSRGEWVAKAEEKKSEWSLNSSCVPISLDNIPWETANAITASSEGSSGVFFLRFPSEIQEERVVVVKGSPSSLSDAFAHDIGRICGVNVPQFRLVRYAENSDHFLIGQTMKKLARNSPNRIFSHRTVTFPVLTIYEFINGQPSYDVDGDNFMISSSSSDEWGVKALYGLGKTLAFDVLINNWDRSPLIWAHEGNAQNFLFKVGDHSTPVVGIDQCVTSPPAAAFERSYRPSILKLIEELKNFHKLNDSILSPKTSKFLCKCLNHLNRDTITDLPLNITHLRVIAGGIIDGMRTIAEKLTADIIQERFEYYRNYAQATIQSLTWGADTMGLYGLTMVNTTFLMNVVQIYKDAEQELILAYRSLDLHPSLSSLSWVTEAEKEAERLKQEEEKKLNLERKLARKAEKQRLLTEARRRKEEADRLAVLARAEAVRTARIALEKKKEAEELTRTAAEKERVRKEEEEKRLAKQANVTKEEEVSDKTEEKEHQPHEEETKPIAPPLPPTEDNAQEAEKEKTGEMAQKVVPRPDLKLKAQGEKKVKFMLGEEDDAPAHTMLEAIERMSPRRGDDERRIIREEEERKREERRLLEKKRRSDEIQRKKDLRKRRAEIRRRREKVRADGADTSPVPARPSSPKVEKLNPQTLSVSG